MSNLTLQQRKKIRDGAPDKTATHWNGQLYLRIINNDWQFYWSGWCQPCEPVADIISLADNDEIIELKERVAELEQENKKLRERNRKLDVDLLRVLFYAPSSPVSAKKAQEIEVWYGKFKQVQLASKGGAE